MPSHHGRIVPVGGAVVRRLTLSGYELDVPVMEGAVVTIGP